MGCAKNVVDSEKLMAQLELNDIEVTESVEHADIAVINTCGFIDAAKEESIDMIVATLQQKAQGRLKKVYAMGCLTQRYMIDLQKEIPEVDRYFGSSNNLTEILKELGAEYKYELLGERMLTTPKHFAYLKISEGCDNPCSFCAIPIMRGKHVSRPIDDLVSEANLLSRKGVKELVVIGQDTTFYGLDNAGTRLLPNLLERLADVDGIEWVRLMYAYPAKFPREVLDVIANHPRICKYIDMPIQHASDEVLKSMRRGISRRATRELIEEIRSKIPDVTLRTTLIVGYPTETEREFDELLRFVEDMQFDLLGVFTYSLEEATAAYDLGDPISADEKERRKSLVMELQQGISEAKNSALIGTTQKVIVDRAEGDQFVGRTERDAPEIDNEVYISGDAMLHSGDFCQVAIESASEYDLYARVIDGETLAVKRLGGSHHHEGQSSISENPRRLT
ncbi:MAG: 30S ribosomal protein S12 methylthiotransferase RimO [Ignavibacteriae bacterium]|nr:30S ribosomal protein S12 methylthiotransferase RimO [Ignavibacteriota bacterium]